jgi:hypothetical protein
MSTRQLTATECGQLLCALVGRHRLYRKATRVDDTTNHSAASVKCHQRAKRCVISRTVYSACGFRKYAIGRRSRQREWRTPAEGSEDTLEPLVN